jgi:hypothetical protein
VNVLVGVEEMEFVRVTDGVGDIVCVGIGVRVDDKEGVGVKEMVGVNDGVCDTVLDGVADSDGEGEIIFVYVVV